MSISRRIRDAAWACLVHFGLSVFVALAFAILVFYVWYPFPYSKLVGGNELFLLVISVDVVCGPLLTLIVFSKQKPRSELIRDISLIVLIQLSALAYGLYSVIGARPVFLAFEGDRFRVVSVPDIDMSHIQAAPEALRTLSLTGPKLMAAALMKAHEPGYLESIQLAVSGLHPAFRPDRWRPYDDYRDEISRAAIPLAKLQDRYPDKQYLIDGELADVSEDSAELGYLPLLAGRHTDWVVVLSLRNGQPRAFLPLDGW